MLSAAGLALGVAGAAAPAASAAPAQPAQRVQKLDQDQLRRLQQIRTALARQGVEAKVRAYLAERGLPMPERPAVEEPSSCEADTEVTRYAQQQAKRLTLTDQVVLGLSLADMLPLVEAVQAKHASQAPVSVTGHGKVLNSTFTQLQVFWKVDGKQIGLRGMTGEMLMNPRRVQAAYQAIGLPKEVSRVLGEALAGYVATSPGLDRGRNALLTFNAMATPAQAGTPARIVMGKGLLQAYDALGHGDVAPQVVLAHEFGHQVQFRLGMIDPKKAPTPQGTRKTELHADAQASYFTSHRKGRAMSAAQQREVLDVVHGIGDCNVSSQGHHGTPAQRRAAAAWGQRQAAGKTAVMPVAGFRSAFQTALPGLLSASAPHAIASLPFQAHHSTPKGEPSCTPHPPLGSPAVACSPAPVPVPGHSPSACRSRTPRRRPSPCPRPTSTSSSTTSWPGTRWTTSTVRSPVPSIPPSTSAPPMTPSTSG
ncbi:hypothetical protein [Luteococcus japonicus]|uniref:hypothetical protein n=1 Tax=Luteococcus japonicus TaxID=33984 RepID=UPI00147437A1|nr:hypothetical protein [Luteococcus japonicus]